MANVIETGTYDAGVYQIETTDPVVGGAAGIANRQAIALANRTKFLLGKVNASLRFDSVISTSGPYTITPADVSKLLYISNMASSGFTFPAASTFPQNQPFIIMASDQTVNAGVQFTPNGSDKFFDGSVVGGASSYTIRTGQRLAITALGSQWFVVGNSESEKHGRIPAGTRVGFAGPNAPDGWLKCNGAAISRATYADLFAAIGTAWGAGDGTTTFNVPDGRGVFSRGLDEGRGLDPGRALGSYQADDFENHTHVWTMQGGDDNLGGTGYVATVNAPSGGMETNNTSISSTGGDETVPKNIAELFIIKY